jgi:hypothetical protein
MQVGTRKQAHGDVGEGIGGLDLSCFERLFPRGGYLEIYL